MIEILNRLKQRPKFLFQILFASLFVNVLALATPIYVIQVLQRYVAYGVTSTLITLVAGVTFITIFEFFFRNIRHRMARELEPLNVALADLVMKKLSAIKTTYYALQKQFRADIITSHLQIIQQTLTATTVLIVVDFPFVSIFLFALFLIHYQLGIIAVCFLFIPFIVLGLYSNNINTSGKQYLNASINTARVYDNASTRAETLRYFGLVDLLNKSWNLLANKLVNVRETLEANKNILSSLFSSLQTLLTIAIIGWGATLAVDGQISVGALIGANILAARAIAPVIRFAQAFEPLSKSDDALKEIRKIMNFPQENQQGTEIKNFNGFINIQDLYFKYPQTRNPIFEGLSCNLKPGEVVAVQGSNGSGKTTLIKTIAGILEFERGKIFFDNIEINQLSLNWIRKNLTYVPQEPQFVDGNFLDNHIGLSQIKENDFKVILNKTDLGNFLNSSDKGIYMTLNNRGEDLPVGIRKRMGLARALVTNGQLVILDEPTEGLDKKGKQAVYALLDDFVKSEKTILVSTLDEEIIKKATYVIDLDRKPRPEIIQNNIKYKLK